MTGLDVEHTKALEAAATPGPWLYCTKTYDGLPLVVAEGYGFPAEPMRQTRGIVCHPEADAEFIAHARTAVPALVAAVERVQALHTPINAADYGVRNRGAITQVCTGCGQDDGNWQYWPCPTIRALEIK